MTSLYEDIQKSNLILHDKFDLKFVKTIQVY